MDERRALSMHRVRRADTSRINCPSNASRFRWRWVDGEGEQAVDGTEWCYRTERGEQSCEVSLGVLQKQWHTKS